MSRPTTVFVKCTFTRGGFKQERVFSIPTPSGEGEYRGLAYIGYCYTKDRKNLPDEEPPAGKSVEGWIIARLIGERGQLVTVQVPDGDLCDVDTSIVEDADGVLV